MTSRIDVIGQNGPTGDHYPVVECPGVELAADKQPSLAELYPEYYKDVRHLEYIDVYRVHRLFPVHDHELHHASKKILLCGVRTGGKPAVKEIREARDTLTRWLEIQEEDRRA